MTSKRDTPDPLPPKPGEKADRGYVPPKTPAKRIPRKDSDLWTGGYVPPKSPAKPKPKPPSNKTPKK